MLSSGEIEQYRQDGFLIKRSVIDRSHINALIASIRQLMIRFGGPEFERFPSDGFLENQAAHDAFIRFREQNPTCFGLVYDVMQSMSTMHRLTTLPAITSMVADLIDAPETAATVGNFLCRMDAPGDTRNNLDWHQDVIFDGEEGNEEGCDGLTAWIPLMHVYPGNGSILVTAGSHKEGRLTDYVRYKRPDALGSEIHKVADSILSRYEAVTVTADPGDVVFISLNNIHRSGTNASQQVRFTAQGRYYNIQSQHFVPGKLHYLRSQGCTALKTVKVDE